jgi:aspartate racemase
MSWESSIEYERLINEAIRDRLGGLHSARLVVVSFDFADIEALQAEGRWSAAAQLLSDGAQRLAAAGAEIIVLCTNTMHRVAAEIESVVAGEFIHIADATAAAITAQGLSTVGLLGTRFMMEGDFYRERMEQRHGLTVLVPEAADREIVHWVIYDELVRGIIRAPSRDDVLGVIERLHAAGAQGIIAGCTEIELLVRADDVTLPYFRSTWLHAMAAVDAALGVGDR